MKQIVTQTGPQLDWQWFASYAWEKQPVLFKGLECFPLASEASLFEAMRTAAEHHRSQSGIRLFSGFFELNRTGWTQDYFLPHATDDGFEEYLRRLVVKTERDLALIFESPGRFCPDLVQNTLIHFDGLFEAVGIPALSTHFDLFAGAYPKTTYGAHQDALGNFMMVLSGTRVMRLWDEVSFPFPDQFRVYHYESGLDSATTIALRPGDLLYWPSSTWHVGESDGFAVSLNLDFELPVFDRQSSLGVADDLLGALRSEVATRYVPTDPNSLPKPLSVEVTELPEDYRQAIAVFQQATTKLEDLAWRLWLSRLSRRGLDQTPMLSFEEAFARFPVSYRMRGDTIEIACMGLRASLPNTEANRHLLKTL